MRLHIPKLSKLFNVFSVIFITKKTWPAAKADTLLALTPLPHSHFPPSPAEASRCLFFKKEMTVSLSHQRQSAIYFFKKRWWEISQLLHFLPPSSAGASSSFYSPQSPRQLAPVSETTLIHLSRFLKLQSLPSTHPLPSTLSFRDISRRF